MLYSRSPIGLLYAVATLAQLLEPAADGARLPCVAVEDLPLFRYRGNNWNLFAEVGGWSGERGDGLREYEARLLRKLDLSARYKINLVLIDGVGWNAERFPGYGAMMQRLNQAARRRGIHLGYVGYSAGYGPPPYFAPVFENRRHYPDGPVYPCSGNPAYENVDRTRTMGTCLSNRPLLAAKQRNLVDFVRRVEPGLVYLHGLDINSIAECEASWAMRCPACRSRWPNDSLCAGDGMAGAYSWYYDALAEAINTVSSGRTDYEARRDCLLYMISPNYTDRHEPDAEGNVHLEYFHVLARELAQPNIVLGIREQFGNRQSSSWRCEQMATALTRDAGPVPFGVFHFYGGDMYHNNAPLLATPALNARFRGADMVINGNGNAYQEPQQLLNAEYCWNPTGSAFLRLEPPVDADRFHREHALLSSGQERPGEIFAAGGFLDTACRSLYGEEAGTWMAAVYRLQGIQPLGELSRSLHRPSVLLPVWNTLMPVGRFSTFRRRDVQWQREIGDAQWRAIDVLRQACEEMARLNRQAVEFTAHAAAACAEREDTASDIAWMGVTLQQGGVLAQLTAAYLDLFQRAHPAACASGPAPQLREEIRALLQRLDDCAATIDASHREAVLDHLGGDVGHRREVVGHLQHELRLMLGTLRSGVFPAPRESLWW